VIKKLYIRDFALIDELSVGMQPGLNILTGQTGAGKSIIIGALNMILGERADTDVIRHGADKAITEAEIYIGQHEPIRKLLDDNAVEYREDLILRREIRSSGSRGFINDTPVTITVLKAVGDYLVDLHGQHDHQLLLKPEHHRVVVDSFGSLDAVTADYREAYEDFRDLERELRALKRRERDLRDKLQLYEFQVQELDEAELEEGEEAELHEELRVLDNAEDLDQHAAHIVELSSDGEVNAMDLLHEIKDQLRDIARIDSDFENYIEEIEAARISVQEMARFTEQYRNGIEFNPQRLEKIRSRLTELNRLQKKYTRTIPELIAYHKEIQKEVDLAQNFDLEIEKLEKKLDAQREVLKKAALKLHDERIAIGEELSTDIAGELHQLGMNDAQFQVQVDWLTDEGKDIEIEGQAVSCTEHGADDIEFYIATNKGEGMKALAKIASGGEISRVMLALKTILAKQQSLPVMIFDEIDSGISGEVSSKVGRKMRALAEHCQILAITHQPQIASQAHTHYQVQKHERDGRTVTRITALSEDEHIREVASLMSGTEVTEASMESARELIGQAS
jgi:DNA repair protein RecN (Recombination protein N)